MKTATPDLVTEKLQNQDPQEVIQNAVDITVNTSLRTGTLQGFELTFNLRGGERATINTELGIVEYYIDGSTITRDIKTHQEAHQTVKAIHSELRQRWKE